MHATAAPLASSWGWAPDPSPKRSPPCLILSKQVKHELSYLAWPGKEWVEPRTAEGGAPMYDALIVGAGQCGLAIAHGLMREKVTNVICLDENEVRAPAGTGAAAPALRRHS